MNPADNISQDFRQLRDRGVDLPLGRLPNPLADDDLVAETLYRDRLYIVSGRNSRWARRRKIALADLRDEPWLLTPSMYSTLIEGFETSNLAVPKVSVRAYSTHQCINLIATDRFISALSGSIIRFSVNQTPFKALPIDFPVRPWTVGLVTLKGRLISPIVQTFMGCVREICATLARSK